MTAALALFVFLLLPAQEDANTVRGQSRDERAPAVGMRARIDDLVLPGPALKAKPASDINAPIVLRVTARRKHGTAHRYDLEYYGLDPGRFDLAEYLIREDGTAATGLPAISVEIQPVLPPGQVQPNELEPLAPPALGGYYVWIGLAAILWVAGLLAILLVGRRRKRAAAVAARPVTLADRLRPMVEAAQRGDLDEGGKAELERLLFAYWRRRLGLAEQKAGPAMIELRRHDEAGELVRQLEAWLHRPGERAEVDIGGLLAPYRDVPADVVPRAASEPA